MGSIVPYNPKQSSLVLLTPTLSIRHPKGNNGRNLILPGKATPEELKTPQKVEDKINMSNWKADMPSQTQEEIDNLFRTDEDVAEREVVFDSLNEQYLERLKQRKEEKAARDKVNATRKKGLSPEEEARELENDAAAQAYYNRKRKYSRRNPLDESASIEDAVKQSVSTKKISRKINYDAMSSIFDDDGNFDIDDDMVSSRQNVDTDGMDGDLAVDV